jgi:hypothetical protein
VCARRPEFIITLGSLYWVLIESSATFGYVSSGFAHKGLIVEQIFSSSGFYYEGKWRSEGMTGCIIGRLWWFSELLCVTRVLFGVFLITFEVLDAPFALSSAVFVNNWWFEEIDKSAAASMTLLERFSQGDIFYYLDELISPDALLTIFSNLFLFCGTSDGYWTLGSSLGETTLIELLFISFIWELLFIMTFYLYVIYCLEDCIKSESS